MMEAANDQPPHPEYDLTDFTRELDYIVWAMAEAKTISLADSIRITREYIKACRLQDPSLKMRFYKYAYGGLWRNE